MNVKAILIYLLLFISSVIFSQNHFVYTLNTGNDAQIVIPTDSNPNIDGVPLSNGDEIGAFTPGGLCVGAVVWASDNALLTVWGDNDQTPEIDGIQAGEKIFFRLWDESTNTEIYFIDIEYGQGNGNYQADAFFVLSAFEAFAPAHVSSIFVNSSQTTFGETNLTLNCSVSNEADVSVAFYTGNLPYFGSLPTGIIIISSYFWVIDSENFIFSDGVISIPTSELIGVTDPSSLVWMKRSSPDENWENIGGTDNGGILESTEPFNSFSEFAIGSSSTENQLPVELSSFKAKTIQGGVILEWQTETELNNYGFKVQRKIKLFNSDWEAIGFIDGAGNSNIPKKYSFIDYNPSGNFIKYRLKQIDNDGSFKYSDETEIEILADNHKLYQNYPNPFNPSTKIRFSLSESQKVQLKIYDAVGNEVKDLFEGNLEAGFHEVTIKAKDLASGIYYYRIKAGNFVDTKKLILLK